MVEVGEVEALGGFVEKRPLRGILSEEIAQNLELGDAGGVCGIEREADGGGDVFQQKFLKVGAQGRETAGEGERNAGRGESGEVLRAKSSVRIFGMRIVVIGSRLPLHGVARGASVLLHHVRQLVAEQATAGG